MKKITALILFSVLLFSLSGCGDFQKPEELTNKSTSSGLKHSADTTNSNNNSSSTVSSADSVSSEVIQKPQKNSTSSKYNYDISALSTTTAYAQISEIINNFSNYDGKTLKMKGTFLVEETEQRNYYACHIADKTACCSVGFEFRLKDEKLKYPDDYPDVNSEITVAGRLSSYKEGDNIYYELVDAELL